MQKLLLVPLLILAVTFSCTTPSGEGDASSEAMKKYGQEFKGTIAKSYEESEEWWPEKKRPPAGAPNVIIFLLFGLVFQSAQVLQHYP